MPAPRIDFYLLAGSGPEPCGATACRLVEKAWRRGHRVHLHAESPAAVQWLDDLLWTWRDESFLPHSVCEPGEAVAAAAPADAAITLGWGVLPGFADDVLVNLDAATPAGYERFARVVEIVDAADSSRSAGRERFRRYREQGCELLTHRL